MIDDGKNRIHFYGIYLNTTIGSHTIDAYVNYDINTHKSCEIYTSIIGFKTIHPLWKWILDRIADFYFNI